MNKLQCTNCGGHINPDTYVCEYCGTRYEKPADRTMMLPPVIVENPKVQTFGAKVLVDQEMVRCLGEEKTAEYCVQQITSSLAEQLAPFISLETDFDPMRCCKIVRGRVRIVEPSFRF